MERLYLATAALLVVTVACCVWAVVDGGPAPVLLTVWCCVVLGAMDRLDRHANDVADAED